MSSQIDFERINAAALRNGRALIQLEEHANLLRRSRYKQKPFGWCSWCRVEHDVACAHLISGGPR
jgi:hypothetical protein